LWTRRHCERIPLSTQPNSLSSKKLKEILEDLLAKSAIELVPAPRQAGFYSRLFLVPKKGGGGWRPVIDLSALNKFLVIPHFKMETFRSIIHAIQPNEWVCSIDLQDAYFHIAVHPQFRKFLRFTLFHKVYQFRAMPFGLSTAPYLFTRLFRAVSSIIHFQAIKMHIYFDDSLIRAANPHLLYNQTTWVLTLFSNLGFCLSTTKSELTPTQDLTFVGFRFLLDKGLVLPTTDKYLALRHLILLIIAQSTVRVRHVLRLLGIMNSLADVVPLGRLHMRPLQLFLLSQWRPVSRTLDTILLLPRSVKNQLVWWSLEQNVLVGVALSKPKPQWTLYTDASNTGWGAELAGHTAHGLWTGACLHEHINVLEMRAVLLALTHFQTLIAQSALLIATDNTTVLAYIEKQGGTRSSTLCALAWQIWSLCHELHVSLSVRHIPGKLNVVADSLSRQLNPVHTEWQLHPQIFQVICRIWDRPHIDLFATHINRQLPTFVSPVPHPEAWEVDALSLEWSRFLGYAFPPFALLTRVVEHIVLHASTIVLIAPAWHTQAWFPSLLQLSLKHPLRLPVRSDLLSQHRMRMLHPLPENLHLHAWWLSGDRSVTEDSRRAFAERISLAHRDSTRSIYQSRWLYFHAWCIKRKSNPLRPTVPVVADFLLHLFRDKSLSVSTIKGYRAAIAATLDSPFHHSIGHSPELSKLIQNFALERPRVRSLVPQWNLNFVMDSLLRAPYEPMSQVDIKFVTWKTVFLLSFASARRRSEIHALSVHPSCLRFNTDHSQVTLRTDPIFLAKNQLPLVTGESIVIPALSPFVGQTEIDRFLCPVRALRYYIDRTSASRAARMRLFLPIKPGSIDISQDTISRWLSQTIKMAYQCQPTSQQTLHSIRPHEIRALSASWALFNHVPMSDIMSAAFWRSNNTFASFYLRSLCQDSEGLYSFGPLVAAQTVVVPPTTSQT